MSNEFMPTKSEKEKSLFDMTLRELQNKADVLIKKGNKTTIQIKNNDTVVKADVIQFPAGNTCSLSTINTRNKTEIDETIKEKLRNGDKQSDIALEVGCSQSKVSRIKRKNKIK